MRTYYALVNITLSVDEDVIQGARRHAKAVGKSVNQLVRDYLGQLAGNSNREALAVELEDAWRHPQGNSHAWKFNREELHERR